MSDPCRGEVWLIRFDPKVEHEIGKTRPACVISEDSIGRLPLRLVVPITEWKQKNEKFVWHVYLHPNDLNGLSKKSSADCFQVKSVALRRFERKLGCLNPDEVEEIAAGVALCVGFTCS